MVYTNGIVGTFVFRNEGDGCLTSKYMNEGEMLPYTEACTLKTRNPTHSGFVGEYSTVWIERNGAKEQANLSITLNTGRNSSKANTFILRWERKNGQTMFIGVGMIFGDLLVGAYWNQDPSNLKNTIPF